MEILGSKEPSYVRCLKPNDAKQPGTLLSCEYLLKNSAVLEIGYNHETMRSREGKYSTVCCL